jgi:hypothetical protein
MTDAWPISPTPSAAQDVRRAVGALGRLSALCLAEGGNVPTSDTERAPTEVYRFYLLWFVGMLIGAAYDLIVAVVGDFEEATIDIVLFLGAAALLFYTTYRRSNLARWLLVPFLCFTVLEVCSHDRALTSGPVAIGFQAAQLMAMSLAVALLFTRAACEWFHRTPSNGAAGAP